MSTPAIHAAVEELLRLDRPGTSRLPADPAYFHDLVSAGHAVCGALFTAERSGEPRAVLRQRIEPVRRMHARAPFISRLQAWPRGYPGDFETIEYLWQGRAYGPDLTSFCLEQHALTSPIAQQHRNKVVEQARQIRRVIGRGESRILVLACGGSPDLRSAQLRREDLEHVEVVLTDADPDAIAFSRQQLGSLADRCEFVIADALRAMRRITGQFDLILAGGLFDYLGDRLCRRLLELGYDRLRPGGRFFFTNLAAGNPYRTWIEYSGDWRLIERSEANVQSLATGLPGAELTIDRDPTGLALLVSLDRRG